MVNFDNTSHISSFDCVMYNGDRVPVSRRKIKETEQAFMNRQFSRMLADEILPPPAVQLLRKEELPFLCADHFGY